MAVVRNKKTKSFSLELDTIQKITDFKNQSNTSSESMALEKIITEWYVMKNNVPKIDKIDYEYLIKRIKEEMTYVVPVVEEDDKEAVNTLSLIENPESDIDLVTNSLLGELI